MDSAATAQRYARAAGILFAFSIIGGFLGELYIPSRLIVATDAAATARNILASEMLFRIGFAAYLVEAICDIALSLVLYVLLRPVDRNLSLLAAFFGLVSTTLYGVGEIFYFASLVILTGGQYLHGFTQDQMDGLAMLSIRMFWRATGIFMALYGVAAIVRGVLIYRSTYLPRPLGVLLVVAGLGFIARNVTVVLAPRYATNLFLAPMFAAIVSLAAWFLFKGVDETKWNARAAAPRDG